MAIVVDHSGVLGADLGDGDFIGGDLSGTMVV
jgi:hypothetical protein